MSVGEMAGRLPGALRRGSDTGKRSARLLHPADSSKAGFVGARAETGEKGALPQGQVSTWVSSWNRSAASAGGTVTHVSASGSLRQPSASSKS